MKRTIAFVIVLSIVSLVYASIWEGTASVGAIGSFPAGGSYAACNAFPLNTLIEIRNLENGRIAKALVTSGLDTPGLFLLLSPEVASILGIQAGNVARVRVSVSKSITELVPLGDGRSLSLDPDINPSALARSSPSPASQATPSPVAVATPSPIAVGTPNPVAVGTPSPIAVATPSPIAVATPSPVAQDTPEESTSRIGAKGNSTSQEPKVLEPDMPRPFSLLVDSRVGSDQAILASPQPSASPQTFYDFGQVLDGNYMSPKATIDENLDLALPGPSYHDTVAMLRLESPKRLSYELDALPEPIQEGEAIRSDKFLDAPDVFARMAPKTDSRTRTLTLAEPGMRIAEGLAESPYIYPINKPRAETPFTKLGMIEPAPLKDMVVDISVERGNIPQGSLDALLEAPREREGEESIEASQQLALSPDGGEANPSIAHEAEPFGTYAPIVLTIAPESKGEETLSVLGLLSPPKMEKLEEELRHVPGVPNDMDEMPDAILARNEGNIERMEPWWALDDPNDSPIEFSVVADKAIEDYAEMIGLQPEEIPLESSLAMEPALPMEGGATALAYEKASIFDPSDSSVGDPSFEPLYDRIVSLSPSAERPPEASERSVIPVTGIESNVITVEPSFSIEQPRSEEKIAEPAKALEKRVDEKDVIATAPKPSLVIEETRPKERDDVKTETQVVAVDVPGKTEAGIPKAIKDIVSPWGTTFAEKLEVGKHYVQIGAFTKEDSAVKAMMDFASSYPLSYQMTSGKIKVFVGPLRPAESGAIMLSVRARGYKDAFVVKP